MPASPAAQNCFDEPDRSRPPFGLAITRRTLLLPMPLPYYLFRPTDRPEVNRALCLQWLLTEGRRLDRNRKRREYYAVFREQILASNRACRKRRGHLWVGRSGRGFIRCVDCGQAFTPANIKTYQRKFRRFSRCLTCAAQSHNGRSLERVVELVNGSYLRLKNQKERVLEEEHLFLYSPCLDPKADPEHDIDPFLLDLQMDAVRRAFDTLSPRHQLVVAGHLRGLTCKHIAKHLRVTRTRIWQMLADAIKAMQRRVRKALVLTLPEEDLPPLR